MAETDATDWRVPCDALHYIVPGVILTAMIGSILAIDIGGTEVGPVRASIWGLVTTVGILLGAWFDDRPIREAVRGRSDAEREAVRQSLRTGLLPPDATFDAYVGWTIEVIRRKWRVLRRLQPWLATLFSVGGLVLALVTGEPLWLVFAMLSGAMALIGRWDLARMDACFAHLERQIAARVPA